MRRHNVFRASAWIRADDARVGSIAGPPGRRGCVDDGAVRVPDLRDIRDGWPPVGAAAARTCRCMWTASWLSVTRGPSEGLPLKRCDPAALQGRPA
ncbi:MAG: hypothetical protein MPK62_02765 [Alphaproteobacteria bacterium]|nr:hypothetical protein [Alphaproteobacteria bacterium]